MCQFFSCKTSANTSTYNSKKNWKTFIKFVSVWHTSQFSLWNENVNRKNVVFFLKLVLSIIKLNFWQESSKFVVVKVKLQKKYLIRFAFLKLAFQSKKSVLPYLVIFKSIAVIHNQFFTLWVQRLLYCFHSLNHEKRT